MGQPSVSSEGLQAPALVLYYVARVTGARVTSGKRSVEENARVGGRSDSKHLQGLAVDLSAKDNPNALTLGLLQFLSSRGGYDSGGTAPHYHYESDAFTLVKLGVSCLLLLAVLR